MSLVSIVCAVFEPRDCRRCCFCFCLLLLPVRVRETPVPPQTPSACSHVAPIGGGGDWSAQAVLPAAAAAAAWRGSRSLSRYLSLSAALLPARPQMSLPKRLKRSVLEFFSYKVHRCSNYYYDTSNLLQEMSPSLRKTILRHRFGSASASASASVAVSVAVAVSLAGQLSSTMPDSYVEVELN